MTTATKDFDSLIDRLQKQHETVSVEMHLPSTGESTTAKKITVEQQTQILTGALKQETQQNVFSYNRVISEIILKNCSEPEDINLVDKIPLAIQLRVDTIGDTMEINDVTYNIDQHVKTVHPLVEPKITELLDTHEHTTDTGITITYSCPPLYVDYDINKSAESEWSTMQGEDIISELFKVEISKYIQQITFQEETINLLELDFKSRLKVCDMLPMSCSKVLVEYIERIKDIEAQYVSLSGATIPMDATLFGA